MLSSRGTIELNLKKVEGQDETPAKIILYTLATEAMREHWNEKLVSIYGEILEYTDCKSEMPNFTAAHFHWYCRYAPSVSVQIFITTTYS